MKVQFLVLGAVALASASAFAQVPAPKPTQPAVCNNCHKPAPGQVAGYFENVAFKSQAIQLGIDADKAIVRFDPKTLKVYDAGVAKTPEHLREVKKGHETRIAYVEKDGQKWATEIRFKGPVKVAKEDLVDYAYVQQTGRPGHGNFMLIDSRPLPRFQQGTIPGSVNIPYPNWDKVVSRLPADKNDAARVLLPGRDLPDEPAVTAQGDRAGLQEHEGLSRGCARVADQGLPRDTSGVRQGSLRRQGHPGRHPRRALCGRGQERAHQGRRRHAGGQREVAPQVLPAGEAAGADHRLRRTRRRRSGHGGARTHQVRPEQRASRAGRTAGMAGGRLRNRVGRTRRDERWPTRPSRGRVRSAWTSSTSWRAARRSTC